MLQSPWVTSRGFSRVTETAMGSSSASLPLLAFAAAAGGSFPCETACAARSVLAFLAAGGGGRGASGSELQLTRKVDQDSRYVSQVSGERSLLPVGGNSRLA